jgi:hypothetical protein
MKKLLREIYWRITLGIIWEYSQSEHVTGAESVVLVDTVEILACGAINKGYLPAPKFTTRK